MNKEERIIIEKAVRAVRCLINESEGVTGLHRNGDIAPWDELERNGRFEAWLRDFNDLETYLFQV